MTVFLGFLFATNCGRDELSPVAEFAEETETQPDEELFTTKLCMDRYSTPPGEVELTPETPDADCSADHEMRGFEIYENFPLTVVLAGIPGVHYCLEVYRMRGYITISHEEGRVTRDGKIFTWCVTAAEEPSEMIVRSLTAQSEIELLVP